MLRLCEQSNFLVRRGEEDRATVFQVEALAAVGFREEAWCVEAK